jgi:hypothetical protein
MCSRSKDGRQWKCRGCSSDHYEVHKPQYLSRVRVSNEARRQRAYLWLWGYLLEHPCVDCGEGDPVVLDFDHVRGVKIGDVKRMATQARSLTMITAEVEKCDVRCANCHRRKTAREQASRFWRWRPKPLYLNKAEHASSKRECASSTLGRFTARWSNGHLTWLSTRRLPVQIRHASPLAPSSIG